MEIAILSKKGIFFTFIAISIITMFLIISSATKFTESRGLSASRARLDILNNYVTDLEEVYLERALYSTSYKAITSLILYMDNQGVFLNNLGVFEEVAVNGTISGANIDSITGQNIMENYTLNNWTKSIAEIARDAVKAETTFNIHRVAINQSSAWDVDVLMNISFTVNSTSAYWSRDGTIIKTKISITNFNDPLYVVNSNNWQKIKKSQTSYNAWGLPSLEQHIANRTYVYEVTAPSFLMRLLNDPSSSVCCGIESLLNSTADYPDSYVDYHFWNHSYSCPNDELYNITGMAYLYFKLDKHHRDKYNVTAYAVKACQ